MTNPNKKPVTLTEAIVYFSDPDRAFRYATELRWPDSHITCPRCNTEKHSFIKTRRIWFCYTCKKQFTLKVGTIFEDSPISLDKWMTAVWMVVSCKNGISSHELGRDLGITQKSAWFVLHRIREALASGSFMKIGGGSEGGAVEVDEAFIGPNPTKMHRSRRLKIKAGDNHMVGKTIVMGMLDRDSRQVRAQVVPNVRRETLQNAILNQIEGGTKVYTDGFHAYENLEYLGAQDYIHETVNHIDEYVRGEVHTQGIENFWSLLKRGLRGTYVAVEPFHLDRYVTEQVFRFNNRATKDNPLNDADRFHIAMAGIGGKRLTYARLTGKDPVPTH